MAQQFSIEKFLQDQGVKYKKGTGGHEILLDQCPTCGKSNKLYVSASKGSFICFHCVTYDPKMRGGPIGLVMLVGQLTFKEAKKLVLGKEVDIKIEDDAVSSLLDLKIESFSFHKGQRALSTSSNEALKPIRLSRYFQPISKEKFPAAIEYLLKRGIHEDIIPNLDVYVSSIQSPYELGEIVAGNKLSDMAKKKMVSIAFDIFKERLDINEENVRTKLKSYGLSETFAANLTDAITAVKYKQRVIFIVRGLDDQPYGWVARTFSKDAKLKVLNSQGTFKNSLMWNFDKVWDSKQLVLAEGIVSAIKCGHKRSVATLGKLVTDSQVRLLRQASAEEVFICLDPDAQAEAFDLKQRILPIFKNVYNVSLPPVKAISCPHCSNKIDVNENESINDLTCQSCNNIIKENVIKDLFIDADYKDAGDYSEEEMEEFINQSRIKDKDGFLLKERVLK